MVRKKCKLIEMFLIRRLRRRPPRTELDERLRNFEGINQIINETVNFLSERDMIRNSETNQVRNNIINSLNNSLDIPSDLFILVPSSEISYLPWYCENASKVESKCSVCWGESGCDIKCKQCIYHFHRECIESHSSARERCPMCRHEIVES